MGLFKTFSFDAVILIVFAFFLFMGIYFGIRRQFVLVLRLALPPVILYFLFDEFLKLHEKTKGFLRSGRTVISPPRCSFISSPIS